MFSRRLKCSFFILATIFFGTFLIFALPHKERKNCDYIYTQVGEHIFRVRPEKIYGIFYKKESQRPWACNSFHKPILADLVSFREKIVLPDQAGEYYVQYYIENKSSNMRLARAIGKLEAEGKSLSDIPLKDGFYHIQSPLKDSNIGRTFIATKDPLLGYNKSPLVLSFCRDHVRILMCSTDIHWKSDIVFRTRPNDYNEKFPLISSADVWEKVFPLYLKNIEIISAQTQE